jgi:hypothetical protein
MDRYREIPYASLWKFAGSSGQIVYVSDVTGEVVQHTVESYGPAARWDRWLYNGLHSLDQPMLYKTRHLWDMLVITFMFGGIALSATACALGLRRIKRAGIFGSGSDLPLFY